MECGACVASATPTDMSKRGGQFVKQLRRAGIAGTRQFGACVAELAEMSASAVDLEIRSLSVDNQGEELGLFIDMIASQLASGRNFELLQAYLAYAPPLTRHNTPAP
jgi:hypothetical protein